MPSYNSPTVETQGPIFFPPFSLPDEFYYMVLVSPSSFFIFIKVKKKSQRKRDKKES